MLLVILAWIQHRKPSLEGDITGALPKIGLNLVAIMGKDTAERSTFAVLLMQTSLALQKIVRPRPRAGKPSIKYSSFRG